MDKIDLIGTLAAICTTLSFFPQVYRIYKTRHTRDLSLPMYIIFSFGVLLWFFYGLFMKSLPIVTANGITLLLSLYILAMKVKYK